MHRALIFAVVALAAAFAPPAVGAGSFVHFQSPSGNLDCIGSSSPAFVQCLAQHAAWPAKRARPAGCELDWSPYELTLERRAVRIGSCRGDVGPLCLGNCNDAALREVREHRADPLPLGHQRHHLPLRARQARRVPDRPRGLDGVARVTSTTAVRERAFAIVRELGPAFAERAAGYDRAAAFPFENYAELRAAGMLGLCIPERYGGMGASFQDYMYVSAELARFCPMTALTYNMHSQTVLWTGILADDLDMPPDQRERHERIRTGLYRWILEDGALMSQPLSEGIARGATAGVATKATPVPGGFEINGRKVFASLAGAADAYNFTCQVEGEEGLRFLSVHSDNPGVKIVGDWDPLGMRGTDSRTLLFEDAFVEADDELLPTGLFDQLAGALAARLPDALADLHRPDARGGRLRAGLPRQHAASRASRRAATWPRSSGPGPRSRSRSSAPARSGSAPWPRPASTRRPTSCGARGSPPTPSWRRRPRWRRSRSARAAAAR